MASDRRGVAAVEFAFIAPVLLAMYFVTMEAGQAIETSKKVGRVASMIGDLIAQQQTVTPADIEAIMKIGESTIQPYNRSDPKIFVTAVEITNETPPKAKVAWSLKLVDGKVDPDEKKGNETAVPNDLKTPGFLIRVRSELGYVPVIAWEAANKPALGFASPFNKITMAETYYMRPRISQTVRCDTCL